MKKNTVVDDKLATLIVTNYNLSNRIVGKIFTFRDRLFGERDEIHSPELREEPDSIKEKALETKSNLTELEAALDVILDEFNIEQ